jgi:hypothetical protein
MKETPRAAKEDAYELRQIKNRCNMRSQNRFVPPFPQRAIRDRQDTQRKSFPNSLRACEAATYE